MFASLGFDPVEAIIAACSGGAVVVGLLKHRAILGLFKQTHVTTSAAVDITDLMQKGIDELERQLKIAQGTIADQAKELQALRAEVAVLSRQITAEGPIQALTEKIDEHIGQVNTLLERLEAK